MLTRYRWYRIRVPRNGNLAEIIAKHPLAPTAQFGFSQIDDPIESPHFRFFSRTSVAITKLDRDGEPSTERISSICFTDFSLTNVKNTTFLRIKNPGKNIRELLNALETLAGIGFTAQAITFENSKPTIVFEKVDASKLLGLKIVGTVPGEDFVTRMEFASKHGMSIEKLSVLTKLQYKTELVQYELIFEGIRGQVVIASNGMVKISGQLSPKILHLIERDLPKTKERM